MHICVTPSPLNNALVFYYQIVCPLNLSVAAKKINFGQTYAHWVCCFKSFAVHTILVPYSSQYCSEAVILASMHYHTLIPSIANGS